MGTDTQSANTFPDKTSIYYCKLLTRDIYAFMHNAILINLLI